MTWINTASYFEDICILELERDHNGVTESIVFINGVFCSPPFFFGGMFPDCMCMGVYRPHLPIVYLKSDKAMTTL